MKTRLFLCFVMCTLLAACAASGAGVTKLTEKDAGTTVHLRPGDTLDVALEGNPTTGFTWEANTDSAGVLEPQGDPQFKADSNALGAGGIMTLTFKAVKAGSVPLKLIYHRTFEPGVAPLKTFEASVVVE